MCKIKDAMERGDYPLEKRYDINRDWEPNDSVCLCPEEPIDEDDNSADEAYERSNEERDYFTRAYGNHEE